MTKYAIGPNDAEVLALDWKYSVVLEDMVKWGWEPTHAATAILNLFAGTDIDVFKVNLGELRRIHEARGRLPRDVFNRAVAASASPDFSADPYLAQEAVSDAAELEPIVDAVLAANQEQVEAYRGGKEGLLGFFVGQVMKETQGKANARVVSELVRSKLGS